MKKIIVISFAFTFMFLFSKVNVAQTASVKESQDDQLSSSKEESVRLFNKKNLNGWYTFIQGRGRDSDPKKVFSVQGKQIRVSGEEYGCITTNEEYENYTLTVEFKWGAKTFSPRLGKARDNGILIHSNGADGSFLGVWMHSIECQIIEGGTGDILVVGDGTGRFSVTSEVASQKHEGAFIYQPGGSLVTINEGRINWFRRDPEWKDTVGFRGKKDVEKPFGQWNKLICVAKGDSVTIFLNGVLVNKATNVKPVKGSIQIQSEGAEIYFRHVELTRRYSR